MQKRLYRHGFALAFWILCWAVFFGAFLVGQEHLSAGDLTGQFWAFAQFQAREMQNGRWPIWSPGSYGGIPFAADPQAAVFYPLRWLTIAFSLGEGLPFYLLQAEILFHVWLTGTFMYLFVHDITQCPTAGLFAALAYALGGYLTGYPLLQMAILEVVTWLPATLWALERGFKAENPIPWFVTAALFLALAVLAGHPQTLLQGAYLVSAWFLWRGRNARWPWHRLLLAGSGTAVGALLLSAAAWLPAWRYMHATSRGDVDYAFVSSGLPFIDWIQALLPTTLSMWVPEYVGFSTMAFALVAPHIPSARRSQVAFWGGAAIVSAWLALGDSGGLFRLAYRLLPGMAFFRQQERWLSLWAISLSIMGALGLAAWLEISATERKRRLGRALGYLLGGMAMGVGLLALWGKDATWQGVALRQGALLLLLWGLSHLKRSRLAGLALLLLLAADLYGLGRQTIWREPSTGENPMPPLWLSALRTQEPTRIDLTHSVYANWGEAYGLETVSGISPLKPKVLEDLAELPRERFWQLLNVSHVLSTEFLPISEGLTLLKHIPAKSFSNQEAEAWLYRVENPMPRAWMVYAAESVSTPEQALERLKDPSWDPSRSVILTVDDPNLSLLEAPHRAPAVHVSRLGARTLEILVDTETPGYLVISEWHYPGWQATVDGQRVETLPANYAFQAVYLPHGHHRVRLYYAAPDVWLGAALSLIGLVACAAVVLFYRPHFLQREKVVIQKAAYNPFPRGCAVRRWMLIGLVLVAFGLRLAGLGAPEMTEDEARMFLLAQSEEPPRFLGASGYPLILRAALTLGDGEWMLRLPAALAGTLLVPLTWRVFGRSRKDWWALLGAALVAGSPLLMAASRSADGRAACALVFLMVATVILLEGVQRCTRRVWLLYSICTLLTCFLMAEAFWALLGHALYLMQRARGGNGAPKEAWAAVAISIAVGAGWWAIGLGPLALQSSLAPERVTHFFHHIWVSLAALVGGDSWEGTMQAIAGVSGVIFLGWLIIQRCPKTRMWLGWLLGSVIGAFIAHYAEKDVLTLAVPGWWGLVWGEGRRLLRRPANENEYITALAAVLLWVILSGGGLWHALESWRAPEKGYRAMAKIVEEESLPGDRLIGLQDDPCLTYYLRHSPLPLEMLLPKAQTPESLARRAGRLWALWPITMSAEDPKSLKWHHRMLSVREWEGDVYSLAAYVPREGWGKVLQPLGISYQGGKILLEGVRVLVNGRLAEGDLLLAPGDTVDVTVVWHAEGPTDKSLTVFVHLIDGQGRLAAQHDGLPLEGTRPTTVWQEGEILLDRHVFQVPEGHLLDGGYIQVGLYDSQTIERVRTDDGRDAVRVCGVSMK